MKIGNSQQLWSNITSGQSYVLKVTPDSQQSIKTDPFGNNRKTPINGPPKCTWDASTNLYRPLTSKFDGYTQMPRPKTIKIVTSTNNTADNKLNSKLPVKAIAINGITQIEKAYGCRLTGVTKRKNQDQESQDAEVKEKIKKIVTNFFETDDSPSTAYTAKSTDAKSDMNKQTTLVKKPRIQSAKVPKCDLLIINDSLKVGLDDTERNQMLLQTKTFDPNGKVQVPQEQKRRIQSALPGGGLNRNPLNGYAQFSDQTRSRQSLNGFNISQRHNGLIKSFMSDSRFELVTKFTETTIDLLAKPPLSQEQQKQSIESGQSAKAGPPSKIAIKQPIVKNKNESTNQLSSRASEDFTAKKVTEGIFRIKDRIEDQANPNDMNTWANKAGLQTKSMVLLQYQKQLVDERRLNVPLVDLEIMDRPNSTKNLFKGVMINTTRAQYQNDLNWIKISCPEVFARRANECISEFNRLDERKKFKKLMDQEIMAKALKLEKQKLKELAR